MVTARDRNDTEGSLRMRRYLPLFEAAAAPDPAKDDWARMGGAAVEPRP